MKIIANQLNKVKNFSDSSSKSQNYDIDAKTAAYFLEKIIDAESNIGKKTVALFNTDSGILAIGVELLSPMASVLILQTLPNELLLSNIRQHGIPTDIIMAESLPFREKVFDFAVVGPAFEKGRQTDLLEIKKGIKLAKNTYCLFKKEHKPLLFENYPNCELLGSVDVKMPGSSHYHKQNDPIAEYLIVKISG